MVNWNNPTVSSNYVDVLPNLNDKLISLAKEDYGSDTNVPTGAIRFNATTKAREKWSGSAWAETAGSERALQALVTTTGTQPTYVATPTIPWIGYVAGDVICLNIHVMNTGAATVNVSGQGAKSVKYKGRALAGGELFNRVFLYYDGTDFILLNHGGGWVDYTPTISALSPMTVTGYIVTSAKYRSDGDLITLEMNITSITLGGTASNTLRMSKATAGSTASVANFCGFVTNNGTTTPMITASSGATFDIYNATISTFTTTGASSFALSGTYRIT